MTSLEKVVLLLLICSAWSQVIGIDLGTEFWKASLISPGKNLVIVENSRSSRKSHNGIAFLDGIRHFQYDAFSKRLKKPKTTYFYLNKLIESLDHPEPLAGHHFENNTYYFSQGEETMSLQQLVGMILKNMKKYASQQADSDIKDAVFTVPAHWGFKARMALVNAAAIAELNALGLINQNTAAAIHFAITRNDSEPINIGFFNLGSHNLQISIVQFFGTMNDKGKSVESLRVLSHVSVPNVGGLDVDASIAEYVASQFQAKHKLDIRKNQKSWVKLLHKCSDAKEVLSANKEVNIYIEGVIDGIDLNMIVKREVLEQSNVFPVIAQKLEESLQKAGITKSELHSVQVIGGASRIPLVNKIVKEFFEPVEVGSHINGDESMAFGSALRAANLSIAFRVKQLYVYDGHPENVRAVVSNAEDGVLSETIIFDKDSEQGLKRQVVVEESEQDIKVAIFYGEELIHEYLLANLSNWKARYNSSLVNITDTPKTHLVFAANSITIAELKEAYVNISLNVSSTRDVYELVVENVTEEETSEKEEEKIVEEEEKQAEKGEEGTEDGSNKAETQETAKAEGKKKKNRERTRSVKKTIEQFKTQFKKFMLKFTSQFQKYKKYTKEQVQALRLVIAKFEKHENYLQEKARVRNDFESTLYSLKDDFENPGLKTFSTQAELEKLKTSVMQELEWLEENAWTAEKVDFERHFRSVQRVYNPIVNRSNEYKERQARYNQTIEILSLVYSKTAELNATQPWVSEKALNHLKKINETFEWIQGKVKEQVSRKLNEDIVFYNQQMIDKAEDLRDQYYLIKMIPRPKVVRKVPEAPKAEAESNKQGEEQSQTNAEEQSANSEEPDSGRANDQAEQKQDL